ncbi:MAG: hypothetical protein MJ252_30620 [archaeon]|nr:hypothetical protein [archaeon]
MGCCGISVYPRNQDIDLSKSRVDLMKALMKLQKDYDAEIADIESHIKKGTQLKNSQLSDLDDASLKNRVKYLGELNDSYQELIKTISSCNDKLPLDQAKDLLQKCIGHYYCAYDQTRRYKQDEKAFQEFAAPYMA